MSNNEETRDQTYHAAVVALRHSGKLVNAYADMVRAAQPVDHDELDDDPVPQEDQLWYRVNLDDNVKDTNTGGNGESKPPVLDATNIIKDYRSDGVHYVYNIEANILYVQGKKNIPIFNLYSRTLNNETNQLDMIRREVNSDMLDDYNNNSKTNYTVVDRNNNIHVWTTNDNITKYVSTNKKALEDYKLPTAGGGKTKKRKLNKKRRHGITKQKRY